MPDALGRIWTSTHGGKGELQELGYAGGRPLGGYVYPNGDAIFCDMVKVRNCIASCSPETALCHA